jgi:hypothetical protein
MARTIKKNCKIFQKVVKNRKKVVKSCQKVVKKLSKSFLKHDQKIGQLLVEN